MPSEVCVLSPQLCIWLAYPHPFKSQRVNPGQSNLDFSTLSLCLLALNVVRTFMVVLYLAFRQFQKIRAVTHVGIFQLCTAAKAIGS